MQEKNYGPKEAWKVLSLVHMGNFCVSNTDTLVFERYADMQILCFKNSLTELTCLISPAFFETQKSVSE